jgi:hypothetical protein
MSDGRIHLELERTTDSAGKEFYFAKLKGPFILDCKDGICFLVFTSDRDHEELQLAPITTPRNKK